MADHRIVPIGFTMKTSPVSFSLSLPFHFAHRQQASTRLPAAARNRGISQALMNLCEHIWVILSQEVHMKAGLLISHTRQMCCEVCLSSHLKPSTPYLCLAKGLAELGGGSRVCLFSSNWSKKWGSTTPLFCLLPSLPHYKVFDLSLWKLIPFPWVWGAYT